MAMMARDSPAPGRGWQKSRFRDDSGVAICRHLHAPTGSGLGQIDPLVLNILTHTS